MCFQAHVVAFRADIEKCCFSCVYFIWNIRQECRMEARVSINIKSRTVRYLHKMEKLGRGKKSLLLTSWTEIVIVLIKVDQPEYQQDGDETAYYMLEKISISINIKALLGYNVSAQSDVIYPLKLTVCTLEWTAVYTQANTSIDFIYSFHTKHVYLITFTLFIHHLFFPSSISQTGPWSEELQQHPPFPPTHPPPNLIILAALHTLQWTKPLPRLLHELLDHY